MLLKKWIYIVAETKNIWKERKQIEETIQLCVHSKPPLRGSCATHRIVFAGLLPFFWKFRSSRKYLLCWHSGKQAFHLKILSVSRFLRYPKIDYGFCTHFRFRTIGLPESLCDFELFRIFGLTCLLYYLWECTYL